MKEYIYYTTCTIDDFVWDEHFRRWVFGLDLDADLFWETWIHLHPDLQLDIHAAKKIVLSLRVKDTLITDDDISKGINSVLLTINSGVSIPGAIVNESYKSAKHGSDINNLKKRSVRLSIAASLILLMFLSFWLRTIKSVNTSNALKETVCGNLMEGNTIDKMMALNLQDGT